MADTKRKKILLINHYAGSPAMGMEFRPYYLAREWVKMGHRVDILAADFSHLRTENPKVDHDFSYEMIDGIRYHWVRTRTYDGNGAARAITMEQFLRNLGKKVNLLQSHLLCLFLQSFLLHAVSHQNRGA